MKGDSWTYSNKNIVPLENRNEKVCSSIYEIRRKSEHNFKILSCIPLCTSEKAKLNNFSKSYTYSFLSMNSILTIDELLSIFKTHWISILFKRYVINIYLCELYVYIYTYVTHIYTCIHIIHIHTHIHIHVYIPKSSDNISTLWFKKIIRFLNYWW